jgi:hypothetical protein
MNEVSNISDNSKMAAACGYTLLPDVAVSALFVRKDSIYKELGVDCWDAERNALNWPGGNPLIAHPPCRAWGQLSHWAKPLPGEKELAIWSIEKIREFGGVLEHPRASRLWKHLDLPVGNMVDEHGGFTMSVDQHWWGHRAKKSTLLYICGTRRSNVPAVPLRFEPVTHVVSTSRGKKYMPEITKKEREATPIEFAKWLIETASLCGGSHCR